jgi:hypothetical protein
MPSLKVVEKQQLDLFDEVVLSPNAKIEHDGDGLTAVYPCNDEENTYVVAEFPHGDEPIEVPNNTVVLGVFNGDVRALVPREAYL